MRVVANRAFQLSSITPGPTRRDVGVYGYEARLPVGPIQFKIVCRLALMLGELGSGVEDREHQEESKDDPCPIKGE